MLPCMQDEDVVLEQCGWTIQFHAVMGDSPPLRHPPDV